MRITLALVPLALLGASCTILRVGTDGSPPRVESSGLIDGHVAVGIPAEEHLFHLDLFDGRSSGAVAQLVIWKLLRLEVGLAGASVGVGPLDVGLGVAFYEPELPEYVEKHEHYEHRDYDEPEPDPTAEDDVLGAPADG